MHRAKVYRYVTYSGQSHRPDLSHVVQGKYAEAESLHELSQAIRVKALGWEHADVAESLNNRGDLIMVQVTTIVFFRKMCVVICRVFCAQQTGLLHAQVKIESIFQEFHKGLTFR